MVLGLQAAAHAFTAGQFECERVCSLLCDALCATEGDQRGLNDSHDSIKNHRGCDCLPQHSLHCSHAPLLSESHHTVTSSSKASEASSRSAAKRPIESDEEEEEEYIETASDSDDSYTEAPAKKVSATRVVHSTPQLFVYWYT